VTLCLCAPSGARANGDPASDYLLSQNLFLPFTTKIDNGAVKRLDGTLRETNTQHFRIRVAVILSPSDLGTAFSLFGKPQKYAEFLGLELSFVYRGRLLVVMPTGYGYSVKGDPDPKASAVLKKLPPPGANATAEVRARVDHVSARRYGDGLLEIVEQKRQGKTTTPPEPKAGPAPPDLMTALTASLDAARTNREKTKKAATGTRTRRKPAASARRKSA